MTPLPGHAPGRHQWDGRLCLCNQPPFSPGDRIELVRMSEDPCPVQPGAQGMVTECQFLHMGPSREQQFWQVYVAWDDGRTLSLVVPPDQARKL